MEVLYARKVHCSIFSYLAVVRQAYGFTLYTTMLRHYESHLSSIFPKINKYVNYSISAVSAKLVAMIFQAPITLLKTRIEKISSASIMEEINIIMKNPMRDSLRGLGSSLVRQSIYTFFHYNTFRYLKDSILMEQYNTNSTFIPAFVAGVVAITVSQPFEVIRSQVSLNRLNESIFSFSLKYFRQHGARGYFYGFLPRLVRKPINSGICWTIYEALHHAE